MSKKIILLFWISVVIIFQYGCSIKWTKAIQYGEVNNVPFNKTIDIDIVAGLIIVPVFIDGELYRFLFDSGAPFSISEKLQDRLEYKIISKGYIVDSDNNRSRVNYVHVDTILVQNIPFVNQTAFVGDFESSPVISCLEIDGIIGSNLMRHCNWMVDYQGKKILLSNDPVVPTSNEYIAVPFHTDIQYNVLVDLKIGKSIVKNLTVDFGSNGAISFPKSVFHKLKQTGSIGTTFTEKGVAQSGIIGDPINITREITYKDTLKIGELILNDIEITSGSSGLIGGEVLSKYHIIIDWDRKYLYMKELDTIENNHETFGFTIGYTNGKNLYIQSVVENSPAFYKGIQPDMQVLKVDSIDFTKSYGFCDYMNYLNNVDDKITLELSGPNGKTKNISLEKELLTKKK